MARNVYFSQGYKQEQHMYEDLTIEALSIYGQDTYYLPRKLVNRDFILNEDQDSKFDDAYLVEMYAENQDGFDGEGDIFAKFGLEIRDEATFIVAKRTWEKTVNIWNNTIDTDRPVEGDIIYLPVSNSLFEITHVEHEKPFYQLQNLPTYTCRAKLFEYNDEDFETGNELIDNLEQWNSDGLNVQVKNLTGTLNIGDVLYQAIERDPSTNEITKWVSGKVVDRSSTGQNVIQGIWEVMFNDITTNDTSVHNLFISTESDTDTYLTNSIDPLVSATVTAEINKIYSIDTPDTDGTFMNDKNAQNYNFEEEADNIIDFSETNPFGEPS